MAIVGKSMFPLQNSIRNITNMKSRFDQLQLQLATGKKASSLSGMSDRFFDLSMRSRLNKLASFSDTMSSVNLRLDVLGSTMGRLDSIESDQRGLVTPGGYGSSGINLATAPALSKARLDEVLNLLNSSIDGRYLFGGSTTDRMPVAELRAVLEGANGKAGFNTVLEERILADRGTDGLGRLDLTSTIDTTTLAQDGTHPFGFKLAALRSTAAGVALTGPTGEPPALSVQFTGVPAAGQSIEISLRMPDGTDEIVRLIATDGAGGPNSFSINAAGTTTAAGPSVATEAGPLIINGQSFAVGIGDDATAIADLINSTGTGGVTAEVGPGGELVLTGDTPATAVEITGTVAGLGLTEGTHAPTASPEASAANFAAALEASLTQLGKTSLAAASTFAASENFFNGQGEPVLRVAGPPLGPPFAEATGLKVASATDTVFWYEGGTQGIRTADMGRLTLGTTGAVTTLGEMSPLAADYGFKIAGVTGALSNAIIGGLTGQANVDNGTAESLSVEFTGPPAPGERLTVNLDLPGGGTRAVTLTVAAGAVAGPGEFAAGATPEETAANFEAALRAGIETATAKAAGSARETVRAQVDDGVNVNYGVQANETGMLELVRTLAAMSTASYATDDPSAPQRFDAMALRNLGRLNEGHNSEAGSLEVIAVELGLAQATMGDIGERHTTQKAQLIDMLGALEGVSNEEVAMEILALKTRLEASYQTTAMIAQMSLVNYL